MADPGAVADFLQRDRKRREANRNFAASPDGQFNGYLTCVSCRRQWSAEYIRAIGAQGCPGCGCQQCVVTNLPYGGREPL